MLPTKWKKNLRINKQQLIKIKYRDVRSMGNKNASPLFLRLVFVRRHLCTNDIFLIPTAAFFSKLSRTSNPRFYDEMVYRRNRETNNICPYQSSLSALSANADPSTASFPATVPYRFYCQTLITLRLSGVRSSVTETQQTSKTAVGYVHVHVHTNLT